MSLPFRVKAFNVSKTYARGIGKKQSLVTNEIFSPFFLLLQSLFCFFALTCFFYFAIDFFHPSPTTPSFCLAIVARGGRAPVPRNCVRGSVNITFGVDHADGSRGMPDHCFATSYDHPAYPCTFPYPSSGHESDFCVSCGETYTLPERMDYENDPFTTNLKYAQGSTDPMGFRQNRSAKDNKHRKPL